MSRRKSTVLTLGVALALVLPMGAAHAAEQPGPDRFNVPSAAAGEDAEDDLRAQIAAAAQEAGDRAGGSHGIQQRKAPAHALDEATQALVDDGAVGVTARVESPTTQWGGAAGAREVGKNPPALQQSPFRTASITKTMVATLVMQEVEAGTFTLDTPVNDLVPDLFPAHPDVTVEHLLTHRSGAQTGTDLSLMTRIDDLDSWEQFIAAVGMDYTDEEHLAVVNDAEWLFEPGTDFNYSNAGYIGLGMILEDVNGQDLAGLLQERVFGPARMRHTTFPDDSDTRGPFLLDAMNTGTPEQGGIGWVALDFDPDVFSAAGAAVTTTRDLNQFTEALITGKLVDPDLVEQMIVPRSVDPMEYGLGIYRLPDPCTPEGEPQQWLYGHDGLTYGTSSVALTSADGTRQVSLAITGRDMTAPPSYDLGELLVPMMLATC